MATSSNLGFDKPPVKLIEPGVKYFLNESLKQCHKIKETYYSLYFNIGMFIFIVLFIGIILIIMYKGKLTPIEKEAKKKKQQQYIMQKIQNLHAIREKEQQQTITNLPKWDSEFDIIHKNIYK